jgi:hypothetical protein
LQVNHYSLHPDTVVFKKKCNPTYSFKLLNGIKKICFTVLDKKKINIEKTVEQLSHSTLRVRIQMDSVPPPFCMALQVFKEKSKKMNMITKKDD